MSTCERADVCGQVGWGVEEGVYGGGRGGAKDEVCVRACWG